MASDLVAVTAELLRLSEDTDHQPYIVRRGILPGLVGFLDNAIIEVVRNAMDALRHLSSHRDNLHLMCKEPLLVPSVWAAFLNSPDADVRALAAEVLANLYEVMLDMYGDDVPEGARLTELESFMDARGADLRSRRERYEEKRRTLAQETGLENVRRYVLISVHGLARQDVQNSVGRVLLDIKGVISFQFNVDEGYIKIFCRCSTQQLLAKLEENGLVVKQHVDDAANASAASSGAPTTPGGTAPGTPTQPATTARNAKARVAYLRGELSADDEPAAKSEHHGGRITLRTGDDALESRFERRSRGAQQPQQSGFWSKLKFW